MMEYKKCNQPQVSPKVSKNQADNSSNKSIAPNKVNNTDGFIGK